MVNREIFSSIKKSLSGLSPIRNPVTVKELRSRMRGRRAFTVLTLYLTLMGSLVLVVFLAFSAASNNSFGPTSRQAGKVVFAAVLTIQVILVLFIGPAFTSATISGEKDRKTYDLLRTTLLPARSLVMGKLLSALAYVLLLILVSIPLQSIAFLLGGLSVLELVLSQLIILTAAVTYALIGLFSSTLMNSTLGSSLATFSVALIMTIGAPFLAGIAVTFLGAFLFGPISPAPIVQSLLIYGGLILASTNLPATLVVSDIFLIEQDSLFFWTEMIDGQSYFLFSPWFVFIALHLGLSAVLFWASIRRVKKVSAH